MAEQLTLETDIAESQLALAKRLDIAVAEFPTTTALVEKIEESLGQGTMLELSRWFVMSVLCHSNKLPWLSLADCELDEEKQYALARRYIHSDEYKQSLRTVLKENRCKFTLIRFAKSRNIEKRTLSTTTKAFKHAQTLLKEESLLTATNTKARKTKSKPSATKKKAADKGSLVDRRAARRGYFDDEFLDFLNPDGEGFKENESGSSLSDEEFAELDAKIDIPGEPVIEGWSGAASEDRSSLIVGLAAGCLMFALVIWAFV